MGGDRQARGKPRLIWVYPDTLGEALDSATWLETTRELLQLGWRVTLISVGTAGEHTIRGVPVHCIPQPEVYLLRKVIYHARIAHFVLSGLDSCDLLLFHQMSAPWLLPLRYVRRLRRRKRPLLVMDTRDLNPIDGNLRDRLRVSFYRFAHWLANRWADGQTAITSRMAEFVQVRPDRLWDTWPSGVLVERFSPARSDRRWPGSGEPIHLMYVGILLRERNPTALAQAVDRANGEGMSFVLSLVGKGPEGPALEAYARETQGRVRVLPAVPHDQIPSLLAQAHVGVTSLPPVDDDKYAASSPIKLFEYMAAGMPILATRNACHTDVAGSGRFVFWAEDATVDGLLATLRMIWHDRDALGELGGEAAQAAEGWSWAAAARKLSVALEQGSHNAFPGLTGGVRSW